MQNIRDVLNRILTSPNGERVYANRFMVLVCSLTSFFEIAFLIIRAITNADTETPIYYKILGNDYIIELIVLLSVAVVWAVCSKLDERIHTVLIILIMIIVVQMLYDYDGSFTFAIDYAVVFATVIYASPLTTLFTGAALLASALVNYFTHLWYIRQYTEVDNEEANLLDWFSNEQFLYHMAFYLPVAVMMSLLLSISLKRLFAYVREYSDIQTITEANNKSAAQIQHQILESSYIEDDAKENVTIYPFIETADYVAGDFYDYYGIDRYHVCFLVADVSGKGMAAGLFMVKTKDVLNVAATDRYNTAKLIERANEELCRNNNECMFATVWLGILDIRTGVVNYTNAGHTSPVLISGNKAVLLNEVSGPMLGLFSNKRYTSHQVKLSEGDKILLYTDGVNEQPVGDKERYGEEGITSYINSHLDDDNLCQGIYGDIVNAMKKNDKKQFDDITMLQLTLNKLRTNTGKIGKEVRRKLYLPADKHSVREVRKLITTELEDSNISKSDINTFYVAVEEMVTNIIKYAYGSAENHHGYSIDFRAEDDYLAIVLKDAGVPFNPFLYDNSVAANKDITEGGRGIKIFTEIMDEYSYKRVDDVNIVSAKKYIKEEI